MAANDEVSLLDGGGEAFPRMLEEIRTARRSIHLEVYTFALDAIGTEFLLALESASHRGVSVHVIIDGWGSMEHAAVISARLRAVGAAVRVYNPLSRLLAGRTWRNHRKILVVDEKIAFLGGINVSDEYDTRGDKPGWADLAVAVKGPAAAWLLRRLHGLHGPPPPHSSVRIRVPGRGGGWRLRRRYLKAIGRARTRIRIAHAYFLPDRHLVRSLTAAARRGVDVVLLLAGRSDVPLARAATLRLYRQFLRAGVRIFEWDRTILHAKAAVVDGQRLLIGSFNLDPLSLSNLEALVEVDDPRVGNVAEQWISSRVERAREIGPRDVERGFLYRLFIEWTGAWVARSAHWLGKLIAPARLPKAAQAPVLPKETGK